MIQESDGRRRGQERMKSFIIEFVISSLLLCQNQYHYIKLYFLYIKLYFLIVVILILHVSFAAQEENGNIVIMSHTI